MCSACPISPFDEEELPFQSTGVQTVTPLGNGKLPKRKSDSAYKVQSFIPKVIAVRLAW